MERSGPLGNIKQWLGRHRTSTTTRRGEKVLKQLMDNELELPSDALDRGFDPRKEWQDVRVSPAKWAACERFCELHEDMTKSS